MIWPTYSPWSPPLETPYGMSLYHNGLTDSAKWGLTLRLSKANITSVSFLVRPTLLYQSLRKESGCWRGWLLIRFLPSCPRDPYDCSPQIKRHHIKKAMMKCANSSASFVAALCSSFFIFHTDYAPCSSNLKSFSLFSHLHLYPAPSSLSPDPYFPLSISVRNLAL